MGAKVKKHANKQHKKKERAARLAAGKGKVPVLRREEFKAKGKRRRALVAAITEQAKATLAGMATPAETAEQVNVRQAREWKEMKAKVAKLKKQRHFLPKKGSKDLKQAAALEIKLLITELEVKHEAERKALGLDVPAEGGAGKPSKGSSMMDD
uniref:Uncharacterized protein n=1 Tax=Alexandrium catenella TaxID=2925 RepID=A0A7S1S7M7_ALECA